MLFSQRIGKKEVKVNFQVEDIDDDLRTRLWNLIDLKLSYLGNNDIVWFYKKLWKDFLVKPIALIPSYNTGQVNLKKCKDHFFNWFFDSEWYEIYDLVEYLVQSEKYNFGESFIEDCNEALELEISSYRIIDKTIARIDSELEISTIEEAIDGTNRIQSVSIHLQSALDFLSNRTKPDYRNSIKESISAVEAYCKKITGDEKATLGKALALIEKKHSLHQSLKTSFSALYGYASDASGIRHALTDEAKEISFDEAKFMLVSCSAFINYLKSLTKDMELK
ncbi:AbiJ-NTD4 domain-containing protein [Sphingobacterium paramultivorum]|uniref:AbiJ-NTD4 domain-containing protein n=1 Tax=Sphingobacterium paramultivorum TaxID=2886510 RepID=UPI00129CF15B|nr:hypothetical protein [Sphingobacterium paramultivorum]